MKKIFCAFMLVCLVCAGAWADVAINAENFPDDTFRGYVSENFDTDGDGVLSDAEIASATEISVNSLSISSLRGIEYFTAVTELHCYDNNLTELDVSKCTALGWLDCTINALTAIDVSQNTALWSLACDRNKITALDVSSNTALRYLYCYSNQLVALDVGNNANLENLDCYSQTRTPLSITSSGNTSYPYQLSFTDYMTSAQTANISDVQGLDSSSNDITTTYSDGVAMFASSPASVRYNYATGYGSTTMDVTISGSSNPTPSGGVEINSTNFPDDTFRSYVSSEFDTNGDGVLSDSEIRGASNISIDDSNMSSLQGIEYFTYLRNLWCEGNQLTSLALSNLDIDELYIDNNKLTSIDLNNSKVRHLRVSNNQLTELDVSGCTNIESLYCDNNQLTALDVSHNTALTKLDCSDNKLITLDVSNNTALTWMSCYSQDVSPLMLTDSGNAEYPYQLDFTAYMTSAQTENVSDVSGFDSEDIIIATTYLDGIAQFETRPAKVTYNYNTGFTGEGGTMAVTISGSYNGVAINAENFPDDVFRAYVSANFDTDSDGFLSSTEIASAENITVNGSGITTLKGIEYFTSLKNLICGDNPLTGLDLSGNTALTTLNCWSCGLSILNLSHNTALVSLDCYGNKLVTLNLKSNLALQHLSCKNNGLIAIDISANEALVTLDCSENRLFILDMRHNTALQKLWCFSNSLTILDVSENTALKELYFYSNDITAIDLSHNTEIVSLDCNHNKLVALDLTNNTKLVSLHCGDNCLRTLDIAPSAPLTDLYCDNQSVKALRIYSDNNPSYPYYAVLDDYVSSDKLAKISGVQAYDSEGEEIQTAYENGTARFAASPERVAYTYYTGISGQVMGVNIDFGGDVEIPTAPTIPTIPTPTPTPTPTPVPTPTPTLTPMPTRIGDFVNFNGHAYRIYDANMTWDEAKSFCESVGGYLATITNQQENDAIIRLISGDAQHMYWLGAEKSGGGNSSDTAEGSMKTTIYWNVSQNGRYVTMNGLDATAHTLDLSGAGTMERVSGDTWRTVPDVFTVTITSPTTAEVVEKDSINVNGSIYDYQVSYTIRKRNTTYASATPSALYDVTVLEGSWAVYNGRGTATGPGGTFDMTLNSGHTNSVNAMGESGGVTFSGIQVRGGSNKWRWITGEEFSFTNWHQGVPSNPESTDRHITLNNDSRYGGQWGWNDEAGSTVVRGVSGFICEWDHELTYLRTFTISPIQNLTARLRERLAQNIGVDQSEITFLTSLDFIPFEPPDPTQAMRDTIARNSGELVAKLNTIKFSKGGWHAFQVTISDDFVGTAVEDLRIYVADESDFIGGALKASFGMLPLVNGVTGGLEINDLFGVKLDTVPKQFIAMMMLSSGKSLTVYIAKILLLLAAGCSAGAGTVALLVVFMISRCFRKRQR